MAALTQAVLRPLAATDSLESLTALLHRAYASLAAMGLNYTAVDQTVEVTRQRVVTGQCFVVEQDRAVIGTATVRGAYDPNREPHARVTPWLYRTDVAHLHQLAVDPLHQGRGHGDRLMAACDAWARERGLRVMLLDTAAPALHLRQRYARLGYVDVDEVQWAGKRYRSVLMAKPLDGPAPSADDAEHRCALVRALWAHVQARDWTAMRAALADDATMHWPCTGESFFDADTIVKVNAVYPEGWRVTLQSVDALADGRVHSVVRVDQGDSAHFANSRFAFNSTRIVSVQEHWSSAEAPPAWRSAALLGNAYRRDASQPA